MNKKRTTRSVAGHLLIGRPQSTNQSPTRAKTKDAPPILLGRDTPQVRRSLDDFVAAVADIFERWVTRRDSPTPSVPTGRM